MYNLMHFSTSDKGPTVIDRYERLWEARAALSRSLHRAGSWTWVSRDRVENRGYGEAFYIEKETESAVAEKRQEREPDGEILFAV